MRKTITTIITIAACALTAYAFWNMDVATENDDEHHEHSHHHHDHDHEHGHHHDHEHNHENDTIAITAEQVKSHGIEVSTAATGKLQQSIKAPAKIIVCADRIAHVYPKVAGAVIESYKNLGQFVAMNETLASIGSREMAEAKAEYLANYNRFQLAEGNFQREKSLYEKKISASQEFHLSENAREDALIELELSRQKLHALGLSEQEIEQLKNSPQNQLRIYEMRSPIAGKVIERHVTPGELVTIDHEAFVIADLDKLWVEINIFPQDRPHVKEGQSVTISTPEGKTAKASIMYLSPIIDEDTRTSTAIAEINNRNGKWFPGTFANAELITEVINVPLAIPKEAIQNIEGVDAVFVPTEEGFSVRPVTIGKSDGSQCEILDGLTAGETYACKNTFLLRAHLQKDEAEHSH